MMPAGINPANLWARGPKQRGLHNTLFGEGGQAGYTRMRGTPTASRPCKPLCLGP